jgi:hypothetical protein
MVARRFPVDSFDQLDELFKWLDKEGFSYQWANEPITIRDGSFETELSFGTQADADKALHDWLGMRYLCP